MKLIFSLCKSKPKAVGMMFVITILISIIDIIFLPSIISNNVVQMDMNKIIIGAVMVAISIISVGIIVIKFNENENKAKLILKLLAIIIIGVLANIAFYLAMKYISMAIYEKIEGTITTAKIIIDSFMSILTLPINAYILSIMSNVIHNDKPIYKAKKYLAFLLLTLLLWISKFIFSMMTVNLVTTVAECIVNALVMALIFIIVIYRHQNKK